MADLFRRGDKVIAYYDAGDKSPVSGWYKAVVIGLGHDENYVVRWEANYRHFDEMPTSSVDADQIRHRSDRGSYSGF